MWKDAPAGFRFKPNKQEMLNYLKNKILGKTRLGYNPINEINILCYEPDALPALAKISSNDLEWYFYSPIVYANAKNTSLKRTTELGFWKPTGKDVIINDMSGAQIGVRKTLVYYNGKGVVQGVRTPWVMHEHHITCLPELPPHLMIYVLCHVKYKGHHRDISYGGNDSVVSHSDIGREMNTGPEVQFDQPPQANPNTSFNDSNLLQQTPEVQDHHPVLEDDQPLQNAFDPNTFAIDNHSNLLPQTPYDDNYTNDCLPNLVQQTPEVQVDRLVRDGLYLNDLSNPLDAINPNMLQQTPEVQVEQPDQDGLLMDEFISPVDVQENHLLSPDEMYNPDTFFNYADNENYGGYELLGHNGWNNETLIAVHGFTMQENRNGYIPKEAKSGIIVDCISDSDDSA